MNTALLNAMPHLWLQGKIYEQPDNVNILINANYISAVQMGSILLTWVCNMFGINVS